MKTSHRLNATIARSGVVALIIAIAIAQSVSAYAGQSSPKGGLKAKSARLDIMLVKPMAVKTGDNQFEVMVKGTAGKAVSGADVSIVFVMPAMPAMKMAEMRNEVMLKPAEAGMYTGTGQVTMAGKWNVTISVKQNGQETGQKKVILTAK